jgi:hypothetical protein
MKTLTAVLLWLVAMPMPARALVDEALDRASEALSFSAFDDQYRVRLSGTLDLEGYYFADVPPGLIDTARDTLLNPRLTLFLDAQLTSRVYAFAQARVDRGFDPSDGGAEVRLDEYALRITPWDDGRLGIQAGKFATIVGNWMGRHLSWDNPFITAPGPYGNLTPASDLEVPSSARDFGGSIPVHQRYEHLPIIWGPSYATGVSVAGRLGKFDYAAEVKNASLSSRPEAWDATERCFAHPTISGRVGWRPGQPWNFGLSASGGAYLDRETEPLLPRGHNRGDYGELVLGQDVSFAWHHVQLWAEFYEARFEVPRAGDAGTFAYYVEAKYKFLPQLFGALRWNQQLFADVPGAEGGRDLWRIDAALGYRPAAHTQLKLQYSLEHETASARDLAHTVAAQLTVRF